MEAQLQEIFTRLETLGMDHEELSFWKGIAPALNDEEKAQLALNLRAQIAVLES